MRTRTRSFDLTGLIKRDARTRVTLTVWYSILHRMGIRGYATAQMRRTGNSTLANRCLVDRVALVGPVTHVTVTVTVTVTLPLRSVARNQDHGSHITGVPQVMSAKCITT